MLKKMALLAAATIALYGCGGAVLLLVLQAKAKVHNQASTTQSKTHLSNLKQVQSFTTSLLLTVNRANL